MKNPMIGLAMVLSSMMTTSSWANGQDGNLPTEGVTVAPSGDFVIPNVPGKSVKAVVVSMAPGGTNESHHHAGSAFIYAYVLEGEIRSQIEGEPARVYKAGEYWTESPGAHHLASWNTSKTKPAKLLAVFIVDTSDKNLTTPDPKH